MTPDRKLLIWTENYWVGGCDRFLVDLIGGLGTAPVRVGLAGNPHPEFDAWLDRRVPWVLPRRVIPVANLVRTPLHRLDRWRHPAAGDPVRAAVADTRPGSRPAGDPGAEPASEALAWRAGIATARYTQATLNFARLTRLFRELAPDVLLINNGGYPGGESCRVAALAARRAGVPRVVHFVHNMAHAPAWPAAVEERLDREVNRAVAVWVTAAHRASDELARLRPIPRETIATVHYGIPVPEAPPAHQPDLRLRAELGFPEQAPGLVAVANLEPRKGLGVLLEALAELRRSGHALPTAIVGEGPMRAQLEAGLVELDLQDTVRLLGWREDVEAIMREATLLALPSLSNECLPYVILEAMAVGLPVVSTDVAGIPEMVQDGVTGRVVPPGDPGAMADALLQLCADPAGARRMGQSGRARVAGQFTVVAMTSAMRDVLLL